MHPASWRDVRILLVDVLLAFALGALILTVTRFAALNQIPLRHPLDALGYGLLVLAAAALALRRVAPLVTLAVTATTITSYLALFYPYGPVFLTLAVAAYSVATRMRPRRSALACGIALVVVLTGHLAEQLAAGWATLLGQLIPMLLFGTGVLVAPWAVGTAVRLHRESGARAREDETRRRAYEERLRVVREVHDVVGHGLSAINLQSGVALHVLDQRPEHARPALEAIRQTSKDALDELRSTLAVFRTGEQTPDRSPAPGLEQLAALAERMRQAGLPVSIDVTGQPRERPATVDLAAYRIVQESLTNVLRHAGPASATVQVCHRPDAVEVTITDDGRGAQADPAATRDIPQGRDARTRETEPQHTESPGSGSQGIVGMRHRATAVGGTLEAGPRPEGGFRVRARLPFADPPSANPPSTEESS